MLTHDGTVGSVLSDVIPAKAGIQYTALLPRKLGRATHMARSAKHLCYWGPTFAGTTIANAAIAWAITPPQAES